MNTPILIRESVLAGVDTRQRLIDLIAVPWDQESVDSVPFMNEVMVKERFLRGAFDGLDTSAGRISVNSGHDRTRPIGKVVNIDPKHHAGLFARAKIAATAKGDEMLQLADEDMVSPSVGYFMKDPADFRLNRRTMTVEIRRAFLDHIGLVGVPAYAGAQVLAVRESGPPAVATPPTPTPARDAFLNDPVLSWVNSRMTRDT